MKSDPRWASSADANEAAVRRAAAAVGATTEAGADAADQAAARVRYRSIYVPFDNSAHALRAVELGIAIAGKSDACVTASHVFAAGLHDRRFRQMEGGLPDRYLEERKLVEQRAVHDDLITHGLQLISDSYLDVVGQRCADARVPFERVTLEGRNWLRLVEDIRACGHDLVVMGALGLGAVGASQVGSVCERVARRIDRDLLVVKSLDGERSGAIVVAIDGSPHSYGALKAALALARIFEQPVEAVAVFDPNFHHAAFRSIAGVLSPAAAGVFRFEEQERLHAEIIDGGLAKIYRAHLDMAATIAAAEGIALRTRLLAGKAFEQILNRVRARDTSLLAVGRIGAHSDSTMDLGSATENLLRAAPCNLLLAARAFEPAGEQVAAATISWTHEAQARMQRVPERARGMARRAVAMHAAAHGHTVVTSDVIDACLAALAQARAPHPVPEKIGQDGPAGECPFSHHARDADRRNAAATEQTAKRGPS